MNAMKRILPLLFLLAGCTEIAPTDTLHDAVKRNDSAAVQQSIVTLIPGMRYAFTTSIFGVVGSVLFTLITRAVYGSTEHTLRSFYGTMYRYAGVVSVDPLTQVAIYQQEQTALIQTMARDLNGPFTENMAAAVRDAVEPLNQSFKSFVNVSTKEQMRFMTFSASA